ncbi:GvpL/GvpF family gas vesicle protein [Corallococcus exiguus]|uniref:GvpL/GvpF family gas vesicle protein n=1 Tax=Corallococcus TaxID=83461 RepID=UPI000EA2BB17|nr:MULTISPECIES: GvpL/GvpF family gas vesicle protein [Corallococcus]NNC17611.1 GvpL/GvpF family gas vesicle protein [Corallococcus exiguus]NRD66832.1 GvpL/GvpF family gas vesicle protein [Corallococcus exiguus]RKH24521.1 GvpL/GvpF family gas vesicle protein [Corallococcus sp. CA041A]RUO91327.1 GvpL/GvpF family gas vesicle protein [Corallococcus sp. AB018]
MTTKTQAESSREGRVHYLYGIVREDSGWTLDLAGLDEAPVRRVHEGGLTALVSEVAGPRVVPTRTYLLMHQRVTEAVVREHTLVPVAFGTVLPSEERVRELLRVARAPLSRALSELEGRVELGLKVYCHGDALTRRLQETRPELARGPAELEEDHEARLEAALHDCTRKDLDGLRAGLRPLAEATHEAPPLGERMMLNTAWLVDRTRVAAFEARVQSLVARLDAYTFRFTGPWPAYSFVDVRLDVEAESTAR